MSVMEICGLKKDFGKVQALSGVDLSVEKGEVYGFIGPNGAGKSTTIRILLGIIKASGGSARIFERDVRREAVAIHRDLAYVPGDVNLWNNLSGGEVIDLFSRLRRSPQSGPRGASAYNAGYRDELIKRFEFDPTKKCGTYSKGNRQKVALIAAFSTPAELYILDEPTSGLDPLMEQVFRQCVAEATERGATVFLSSHILSEVEQLCDRISIIRSGRIIDSGTLDELRHLTRNKVTCEASAPLEGLAQVPGVFNLRVEGGAGVVDGLTGGPTGGVTASFDMDNAQTAAVLAFLADKDVRHFVSTPPTLEELFMSHYATN